MAASAERAHVRAGLAVPLLASAVLAAAFSATGAYSRYVAALVVVHVMAVLSLNLLMGYAGQVSLGQAALVGVGAYAAAQLVAWDVPFVLVVPAAALTTAAAATVVGLPSLRIRGLQLAATTLAFGVVAERLLFARPWDPSSALGVAAARPAAVADDGRFLLFVLAAFGALAALDVAVRRSRVGRAFVAVREREDTAASRGVSVARTKLLAYALSGFYAGVAGACYAFLLERVTPGPFTMWASLSYVATVVVGGLGSFGGVVVAGSVFTALPEVMRSAATASPFVGAVLLAVVPIVRPGGVGWVLGRRVPLPWRRRPRVAAQDGAAAGAVMTSPRRAVPLAVPVLTPLRVGGVEVRFGGLDVLRGVDLEVRRGERVGLIGPNGAGKSTLFDCISGFTSPRRGAIHYRGRDLLALPPEARAALGIGRTFQHVGLCRGQTVRENALIAQHDLARYPVWAALARTPSARRTERDIARRVDAALDLVGIAGLAGERVADLPHGRQRLAEVACVLATGPDLLLLDEPAAGMDPAETRELAALLRRIGGELGLTMLVIDHHVPFVAEVCEYVYVLVDGQVLTEGTPAEVRADPAVVEIYFGATAEPVRAMEVARA